MPRTARRTLLNTTSTAYIMRECEFLLKYIFQYKYKIIDYVHMRENNGQLEPVLSHVLHSYY